MSEGDDESQGEEEAASFKKLKDPCQSKQLGMWGSTCLWLILTIWHLLKLPPFVFSTMKWFCIPAFSPSFLPSLSGHHVASPLPFISHIPAITGER